MSSGNIDAALISKLAGDATLTSLAPGGVYREVAPLGVAEPYVIVQLMNHRDEYQLARGQAFEDSTYMVKAVQASTSGSAVQAAADRIQALLHNGSLTITGYRLTDLERIERIAYVEIDDDRDRRYQHRGGLYQVLVEPA